MLEAGLLIGADAAKQAAVNTRRDSLLPLSPVFSDPAFYY
jgi:hypothetical protein